MKKAPVWALAFVALVLLFAPKAMAVEVTVSDFGELEAAIAAPDTTVIFIDATIAKPKTEAFDVEIDGKGLTLKRAPDFTGAFFKLEGTRGARPHLDIVQSLTLSNITLDGASNPASVDVVSPLILVYGGVTGVLNVENGTTLKNNKCTAAGGGAGAVHNQGTFIMNGGLITGNTSLGGGGGVSNSGTFAMNGGTITGNTATTAGGGVSNGGDKGAFTMTGGAITGNSSSSGSCMDALAQQANSATAYFRISGDAVIGSLGIQANTTALQLGGPLAGNASIGIENNVDWDPPFKVVDNAATGAPGYAPSDSDLERFYVVDPPAYHFLTEYNGIYNSVARQDPNTFILSEATTAPTAPLSLTATAGAGQVSLSWNVPASNGGKPITGYNVYRDGVLISTAAGTTYIDTGVTAGVTYTYAVKAVNEEGEGPHSNDASATPTAGNPGNGAGLNPGFNPHSTLTFTNRTLTDGATGVSVNGYFTSGASLTVRANTLHVEGACAACAYIRARIAEGGLIVLYDLSATSYRGDEVIVTIPVGTRYDGQVLTVLHCNKGVLEQALITCVDGSVTGAFGSLSPYAVFEGADVSVPDDVVVDAPKTGDEPYAFYGAIALLCAMGALMMRRRQTR